MALLKSIHSYLRTRTRGHVKLHEVAWVVYRNLPPGEDSLRPLGRVHITKEEKGSDRTCNHIWRTALRILRDFGDKPKFRKPSQAHNHPTTIPHTNKTL